MSEISFIFLFQVTQALLSCFQMSPLYALGIRPIFCIALQFLTHFVTCLLPAHTFHISFAHFFLRWVLLLPRLASGF